MHPALTPKTCKNRFQVKEGAPFIFYTKSLRRWMVKKGVMPPWRNLNCRRNGSKNTWGDKSLQHADRHNKSRRSTPVFHWWQLTCEWHKYAMSSVINSKINEAKRWRDRHDDEDRSPTPTQSPPLIDTIMTDPTALINTLSAALQSSNIASGKSALNQLKVCLHQITKRLLWSPSFSPNHISLQLIQPNPLNNTQQQRYGC